MQYAVSVELICNFSLVMIINLQCAVFKLFYQELTQREIEYVALSRDTTESDLKQRREISCGSSHYVNQVRSHVFGIAREHETNKCVMLLD